jgi:hypothetical protein
MRGHDLVEQTLKLAQPRARDDYRIAPAVSFFGDPQEAAAFVFTKLNEEVFALNLQLARLKYGIHRQLLFGRGLIECQVCLRNNLFLRGRALKISGGLEIHLLFEHIDPGDEHFDFIADLIDLAGPATGETPPRGVENIEITGQR